MTLTVDMTPEQRAQWASDNSVSPADVPTDVAAYVLHNLLQPSNARQEYWRHVDLNLTPHPDDACLHWQSHTTQPDCDEIAIETTWGTWPYRIIGYHNEAILERFVPSDEGRRRIITRGDRTFDAMMAEARAAAEVWDRDQ